MSTVRFIGLDVHADTIAVAMAEPSGEVRSMGVIPNRPESIRKLVKKLGPAEPLRVCYEAGPTGHVVYWHLAYSRRWVLRADALAEAEAKRRELERKGWEPVEDCQPQETSECRSGGNAPPHPHVDPARKSGI
jgi:hypothetical protein